MDTNDYIYKLLQDPSFERWVRENPVEDATYWEQWLYEHPHRSGEVERARALVLGLSFHRHHIPSAQIEASWRQLAGRTVQAENKQPSWLQPSFRFAAAVSLLVLAGIGIWIGYISATTTTYRTPYGTTQEILLKDGTRVILNANSELSFANDWLNQPRREVYLEGEAYFSVEHRTGQTRNDMPFVVHTRDLSVKVLGTQFNVNSRRGNTQVVLDKGKVALQIPESDEATMQPGDFIMYSSEKKKITRHQVNPDIYTSWRKQLLTLNDTPLEHIIAQLEDTYGVTFVLPNEVIKNRKISSTGSIAAEDLDTILSALSTLLQVEIKRKSNTIYIYEN